MFDIDPIEDPAATDTDPARPRFWMSHALTAALLCLVSMFVDKQLRFDWNEARLLPPLESLLAVYGLLCALVSLARGILIGFDQIAMAGCCALFLFTAYVALLMPRGIHN